MKIKNRNPAQTTDTDKPSDPTAGFGISRRQFMQGAAGVALAGAGIPLIAHASKNRAMNFVSYGGSYGAAVKKYLVEPFEKESGISVNFGVNSALAPIKIQVLTNNVQWDLVEIAGGDFVAGLKDNLFEPIDTSIVNLANVPKFAQSRYGVEYALFLSGMGYDRRKIQQADAPTSWKQFWDTKRYPGIRALSKHISDTMTLEAALLAAGVPLDKLYPIDVKLALNSLRTLGKDNIFWYEHNQQPVNFLEQQRGPLVELASGRVAIANRNGAEIGFVYEQMQLNGDYLVVPKGSKNKEEAFRLMNFILTNDDADVRWMKETTYAISNTRAVKRMPKNIASHMPTSESLKGKYFVKDFDWWGKNLDKVVIEFQQFIST